MFHTFYLIMFHTFFSLVSVACADLVDQSDARISYGMA